MALATTVSFQLPNHAVVTLRPGDLIGWTVSAALPLNDPRISEAHALVSLRRGELYLLGLRRMLGLRGKAVSEVHLEPELEIERSEANVLRVVAVTRPSHILAIEHATLGTRPLGEITSILAGPPPQLLCRFVPLAAVHIWSTGPHTWQLRDATGTHTLEPGATLDVGDERYHITTVPLASMAVTPTLRHGRLEQPLHVIVYYDSIELHRANQPAVLISGVSARLFSELVAFSGPVSWELVAREIWRDGCEAMELRHRWDVALGRLRQRLRAAGVRDDLIRSDGSGQLQLILYESDQVIERM